MKARTHQFDQKILRQYDIRGTWGENLCENDAILLAERLTSILIARKNQHANDCKNYCALVARDGRHSSKALSQALLVGFRQSAIKAIDLGLLPTPALYFAESHLRENINAIEANQKQTNPAKVLCAIMVTGSHNPPQQNGFKIVEAGKPFFGRDIQELAQAPIEENKVAAKSASKYLKQKNQQENNNEKSGDIDIADTYIAQLLREDQRVQGGEIQAVWDAGGGATANILKTLLPKLSGEHSLLFADIDPWFKARSPDPSKPLALSALREEVLKNGSGKHNSSLGSNLGGSLGSNLGARVGLAFDGDGDRLLVMLQDGSCLTGERLLLLFAEDLIKSHLIKNHLIKNHKKNMKQEPSNEEFCTNSAPLILCDIKTSPNILQRIRELGGVPKLVPTGHANIKHALNELGADMAGELSGHLFFKDRYLGYDDAIYAAVRLCALLRGGLSIEKTLAALPASVSSGELRLPIGETEKFTLIEKIRGKLEKQNIGDSNRTARTAKRTVDSWRTGNYSLCTLDGVRVECENAWWLVRASNTEPAIVLRAEANEAKTCRDMLMSIARLLAECGADYSEELASIELVYS